MPAVARPYDLVVWGASGFTGRLVCEHLARDYTGRVRWAMAGRSQKKLEDVRQIVATINPACKEVPILIADADNAAAVGSVLQQTQVVLSTAGPFAKHGNTVVEQSIAQGTHYCDITGEVAWVRRNVQRHHAAAAAAGVRVVHCCGYDSVPSDLGALMMVEHAQRELGRGVSRVISLVREGAGGVSGGTVASAAHMIATEPLAELRAMGTDQYYLGGVHGYRGSDRPAPSRPFYEPIALTWTMPFVMEGVNARIVQLSAALSRTPGPHADAPASPSSAPPEGPKTSSQTRYGRDFKFLEAYACSGMLAATMGTLAMGALGGALVVPPLRNLLTRMIPAGSGPSEAARLNGHWRHELVAVTEPLAEGQGGLRQGVAADPRPLVLHGECGDPRRDPGYWSTARMLLEAGLCMVLDADKLRAQAQESPPQVGGDVSGPPLLQPGGVLTPASAFGMVMVERLRQAGFTWRVDLARVEPLVP